MENTQVIIEEWKGPGKQDGPTMRLLRSQKAKTFLNHPEGTRRLRSDSSDIKIVTLK